jgi:hypothetical protein
MSNAANPYAPPAARVDDVPANSAADALRREHISHESSIKAVGLLFYLGGALVTIGAATALVSLVSSGAMAPMLPLALVALGLAQLFAGWGVRRLRVSGRNVGGAISVLGLLKFPYGTMINAYILYLLFSKKGRTIFSPEYKDVIAATPDIKYRTSILIWIFLAVVILALGAAIVVPWLRG